MRTEDWLVQGNLGEALTQARRDVTSNPESFGLRFLLFELLVLVEEFNQAEDELRYATAADPNIADGVELYLGLLSAERLRYNWMTKAQGSPNGLLKPPDYAAKFVEASSLLCEARVKEAEVLLREGWQQVPKLSGSLDGKRFSEIRDADDVLGPFLEALVPGHYYWIPFEQIQRVEFQPKHGYQDTIWIPAYIEMKEGVRGNLWFPSLYSGTSKKSALSKLGQLTEWEYPSPNVARAYGQRDLKTDEILQGIRQVSTILLDNSG